MPHNLFISAAGGEATVNERLWDLYEQLCMVEMVPLEDFVHRIKSGEWPMKCLNKPRRCLRT